MPITKEEILAVNEEQINDNLLDCALVLINMWEQSGYEFHLHKGKGEDEECEEYYNVSGKDNGIYVLFGKDDSIEVEIDIIKDKVDICIGSCSATCFQYDIDNVNYAEIINIVIRYENLD